MAIQQRKKQQPQLSYFERKPEVAKIFKDLEDLLDYCRFELLPYNPADLYNNRSRVWNMYQNSKNPEGQKVRRPYLGKKPNKFANNKKPYKK